MRWRIVVTRARRVAGAAREEEPDEDNPGDAARRCAGIVPAPGRVMVTGGSAGQVSGHAVLVAGVALLRPEEQVLEAMLAGWAGQQAARGLGGETISGRQGRIRSFTDHAGCPPWLWTPQLFEEWCADLRSVHHVAASTLRGQAGAVRLFCEYLTDPVYAWAEVCWGYFGTHPVQVCTRWNTPRHVQDGESGPERRAFTVAELQVFFDHLDDRVAAVHGSGRKGWLPAFRDAVLVKTAYAFGLFSGGRLTVARCGAGASCGELLQHITRVWRSSSLLIRSLARADLPHVQHFTRRRRLVDHGSTRMIREGVPFAPALTPREGLRRREVSMLDLADLSANPRAPEFGRYGVCQVRYGEASAGSPPRRRSVLTVWGWLPEILDQWITEVRPALARDGTAALWPSERGPRIGLPAIDRRFAAERDVPGLDAGLEFHSLRRSHITHLIEAGWDPLFVQQQAGHAHASTTSLYTCVSSDFRTRTLRRVLDETISAALDPGEGHEG